MSEERDKTTEIYKFLLTRTDSDGESIPHISDFHYLAFIRNPITKQATYIDAQAMVALTTLATIETEISVGRFHTYELTGYQLKNMDETNKLNSNIQKKFYSTFVIILAVDKQKHDITSDRALQEAAIPVRMLLVHPVAWELSKNTGFNRIFRPYTLTKENTQNPCLLALETIINNEFNPQLEVSQISSFTDHVIKKYAGERKNIKQIVFGDRASLNMKCYSQIVIPPTLPEINIPEYIINTYKPFTTPSFWFFDTFNFANYDGNSENFNGRIPIWCFLINFYNCLNTFKKVDMSDNSIFTSFTHLLKTSSFIDVMGILSRPNATINFIGPNMTQTLEKLGDLPSLKLADNTSEKQTDRVTSLKVYYPDNLDSARNRIIDCIKLFTEHIDQIEHYETTNTTPYWLQFGKLYNFERDRDTGINRNEFIHTPITIVNTFKRRQLKDNSLEHIVKYTMLRLINTKNQ